MPEELQKFLGDDKDENVSVLHLNNRSINKIFENFKMFLSNLNLSFSIICFSETWLNDSNVDKSNYELPNYVSLHQIRNHYKGGGVSVYIHKNFEFKIRNDFSINSKGIESIGVELLCEKRRNTLFNVICRPPNGKIEPFENFLKILFNKNKNSNKNHRIAGDFNLNLLDHDKNKKVRDFLNLIYQNGMIPTINKPTSVTKKTATAIDHIITNSFVENTFKTAIIKTDVSDHFQFALFSLQQTYLQKMMLSINIKESLMIKKLKLFFKISINMTGIPLKPIRMLMKLTIISYRHFVLYLYY